jgi:hypothetical protein
VLLMAIALVAWFGTQKMLANRPPLEGRIGDAIHQWTAPTHQYLIDHPATADKLLIASSLGIDALGVFVILVSIFGKTARPMIGLFMVFMLRQACQALCALPPPEGMIWRDPGFPSLLVTYGVASDLFFSGHTAIAVIGAIELARFNRKWGLPLGIALGVFEMITVLLLRAHYTMDVYAGFVTAIVAAIAANYVGIWVDRKLGATPAPTV